MSDSDHLHVAENRDRLRAATRAVGGMVAGALASIVVVLIAGAVVTPRASRSRLVPEDASGHLRRIAIHYVPAMDGRAMPVWRDLFAELPGDVQVEVAVTRREDFDRFLRALRSAAIGHLERTLELVATGVYRVNPSPFGFLWIAANELPLADELIPFLIARSGRPLDAFVGWVKNRRPIEWLLRVLAYLPMSTAAHEDLRSYVFPKTDDPVVRARQRMIAEWAVESSPEMRDKLVGEGRMEGRMEEARSSLRHVLALRGLALSAAEEARIDACGDLDTLRRWHDQAVVVASAAEALQ